jgi:crossover junction endodeoxyribonuclease RuvC
MIILGIDPGYDRCGFALLEKEGSKERLLYSGCYTTDAKLDFAERLSGVGAEFMRLVGAYAPNLCALEKVYFTSNQKTAMHVAEVRGMLLYLAQTHGMSVRQYNPNEIKVAIAGDGRADKKQVIFMVPRLVQIDKHIKYDDEYDAIAVALTASARMATSYKLQANRLSPGAPSCIFVAVLIKLLASG